MDRNTQLGVVAAREAVSHSRIIEDQVDKNRVGVIWGSGWRFRNFQKPEVLGWAKSEGIPRFNPFFIPKMIADITPVMFLWNTVFHGP